MRETPGLGPYLDGLAREGHSREQLDFSIDQAKAVQKLSKSQLPEPGLWIVKMVQAGVASGGSEIDIKLGRNRVEVTFATELSRSALELFELVISGVLPKESALLHLVTGIRTSFAGPGVSFLLQVRNPKGREFVALTEGESYHYCDETKASVKNTLSFVVQRPYRMLGLKKSLHKPVRCLLKGTAEEHSELVARCWTSPIPIKLDGRYLDTRYDSPLIHNENPGAASKLFRWASQNRFPRLNLYQRCLPPTEGEPSLPPPQAVAPERTKVELEGQQILVRRPVFSNETFLEWECSNERVGAVILCPIGIKRCGVLCFIQDGVVVQRVGMTLYDTNLKLFGKKIKQAVVGGECCLVAVEQSDLDLSHFRVRDVEQKRERVLHSIVLPNRECEDASYRLMRNFYFIPSSRTKAKFALGLAASAALPVGVSFGAGAICGYLAAQSLYSAMMMVQGQVPFTYSYKKQYKKEAKKRVDHSLKDIEQPPISS